MLVNSSTSFTIYPRTSATWFLSTCCLPRGTRGHPCHRSKVKTGKSCNRKTNKIGHQLTDLHTVNRLLGLQSTSLHKCTFNLYFANHVMSRGCINHFFLYQPFFLNKSFIPFGTYHILNIVSCINVLMHYRVVLQTNIRNIFWKKYGYKSAWSDFLFYH